MELPPEVIEKSGKGKFLYMREESLKDEESLIDYEDLEMLREAKALGGQKISLQDLEKELALN